MHFMLMYFETTTAATKDNNRDDRQIMYTNSILLLNLLKFLKIIIQLFSSHWKKDF